MAQPLQGNIALPNQEPLTHRVWLRASEVRKSLDSLRQQQQQSPPQPSDRRELSATSRSPLSALSHQIDTQHISPVGGALSSPIALQRVSPDYGPISGGEKIFLVGYGFSEGQDLLVRFGDGTEPVGTKLFNPNILECILPPSHSTRRVVVTLYWEDGPEVQNEGEVLFTYEDVDNEITSSSHRVLNLWRQKSSRLKYNPSQYSFTVSSMGGPPVSIESRNILTTEMADTSIQDEDLSSDSDTGNDFGPLSPVPWSSGDRNSVNLVNNRGQNLAHICTQLGHHSLLINVIEKGANIHAEDMNRRTPLDFARLYRDEGAIDILEGDWDDNIQNVISTGLLLVGLLHRYIPECVLAIQTIKISVGIRKGSGDFAQVRPMLAPVQGAPRPDKFPSYNPAGPRMDPLDEHDESDESNIPIINTSIGRRRKPAPRYSSDQASESVKHPESIKTNNSGGASGGLLLSSPNLSETDRTKALASIYYGDFRPEEEGRHQLSSFSTSIGRNRKPVPRYSSDQASESIKRPESIKTNNLGAASARLLLSPPNLSEPGRTKALTRFYYADSRPPRLNIARVRDKEPSVLRKRTNGDPMPESPDTDGAMKRPAPMSVSAAGPSGKAGAGGTINLKPGVNSLNQLLETLGEADFSGWIMKKGERYNTWKMRFFYLKGPHMYYLRSKTETKVKGYINIHGYKVVADDTVNPGRYGFRIIHDVNKPHAFASDEHAVAREWMKALMNATIERDYTCPVISSANIPTIPLTVAQAMNPAPRPPSPTQRDAVQRAMRAGAPIELSSRDARVLMGVLGDGTRSPPPPRADQFYGGVIPPAPARPSREMRRTMAAAMSHNDMRT